MKRIKNILFDFDGVIVDSVNIKTEAFRRLYQEFSDEIANKVVEHHIANGGMSRFDKFRLYHKEFLEIKIGEPEVKHLSERFSRLVKQGVIEAPEIKGSHTFLNDYCDVYNMFIITGTPTDESKEICKARNIYSCFKGIYGSPESKDYWTKYLINKYNLIIEETIFVGDALVDYNAAIGNGMNFWLRVTEENELLFRNINNIQRFSDYIEFTELIL